MNQLDLFSHVAGAYASSSDGELTNEALYRVVADRAGIDIGDMNSTVPIGKAGTQRSPIKRAVRWYQQDLRAMGVIEKVPDARGVWRLTEDAGRKLKPIVKNLAPQGSVVLNVSQDIFMNRSPARSTYNERLVLAICDRLGLHLMDRFVWHNPSKPPGPIQWASKQRVQLNVAYEPVYWFAADPHRVNADNRRVLRPHSARHAALIARGGEQRQAVFGDGAYRINHGSFGNPTAGAIPRNVLAYGHQCADSAAHRRHARDLGFTTHGAPFPHSIPNFFIRFLTEVGQLVVDMFSGTHKTALAAERLGRRWLTTENVLDYIRPSAEMFRSFPGFEISPGFEGVRGCG